MSSASRGVSNVALPDRAFYALWQEGVTRIDGWLRSLPQLLDRRGGSRPHSKALSIKTLPVGDSLMRRPYPFRWMYACFLFILSGAASADCFHDAASFHRVNPLILRAIAIVESGGRPEATNRNRNGSVDYGMMQINSIHLPELARYGVGVSDLYDGCKSVFTGALILRRSIDRYGNTWAAVGSYNSATPYFRDRYAAKVRSVVNYLLSHGYADEAQ